MRRPAMLLPSSPRGSVAATLLLLALLMGLLAGCATGPVQGLAEQTSDRAVDLALGLDRAGQEGAAALRVRAERVARLGAATAAARARFEQEQALATKLGRDELAAAFATLRQLTADAADRQAAARIAGIAAVAGTAGSTAEADTLREIAARLLELAGDAGPAQRAAFLIGFVDEVDHDLLAAGQVAIRAAAAAAGPAPATATRQGDEG